MNVETSSSLQISPAKQDWNLSNVGSAIDSNSGNNRPPRRRTTIYTHFSDGGSGSHSSDGDDIEQRNAPSSYLEPEDTSDSEFESPPLKKTKRKTNKSKKTPTKVDHGNKITPNKHHSPNPKKLKTEGSNEAKVTSNKEQHLQSQIPDPYAEQPKHKTVTVACEFCPISVSKNYIWQHLEKKHPEKLLKSDLDEQCRIKCDLCPYTCKLQRALVSHTLKAHVVDKPCECDICFESFLTEEMLQKHAKKDHEDKNFNCKYCRTKPFQNSVSLRKHIETVHKTCGSESSGSSNHLLCPVCGSLFLTDADLAMHLKKPESKSVLKCELCTEPVYTPCRLSLHLQKVHSDTPIKIEASIKREQLEAIIESPATKEPLRSKTKTSASVNKNQKSPNKFSCVVCTAHFPRRCDLDFHELQEDHRRWKCPICAKLLKSKYELRYHIPAVHSDNVRPFKCTHEGCSESFKLVRNLRKHMIMHDPDRVHCKHCYNYFSKEAYQMHFDTYHKRDEPFKCDVCSKTFSTQKCLKRHQHIHTDRTEERCFPCKFCGAVYKYSKGRSRHLKKCKVRLEDERQEYSERRNVSLGFADNPKLVEKPDISCNVKTEILSAQPNETFSSKSTGTTELTRATDSLHGNGTDLMFIKQEADSQYVGENSSDFDDRPGLEGSGVKLEMLFKQEMQTYSDA